MTHPGSSSQCSAPPISIHRLKNTRDAVCNPPTQRLTAHLLSSPQRQSTGQGYSLDYVGMFVFVFSSFRISNCLAHNSSSHSFGTARHSPLALTSTLQAGLSHTSRKRKSVTYQVELPRSWLMVGCATSKPGVCVVVVTPGAGRAR